MSVFRLKLPNDLAILERLPQELSDYGKRVELTHEITSCLQLVVEELFVNFVEHCVARDGEMEMAIERRDSVLFVTLQDDGPPFNPLDAPSPDLEASLDDREIGGLGLHLVKEMSDEISYERVDGRNTVELKFRLN